MFVVVLLLSWQNSQSILMSFEALKTNSKISMEGYSTTSKYAMVEINEKRRKGKDGSIEIGLPQRKNHNQ